ncbi:MAG: hypothetical protein H0U51_05260 [Propionibacteriales bacterium]|nr:hypothetical protein [Propionibacteriales bacterium]
MDDRQPSAFMQQIAKRLGFEPRKRIAELHSAHLDLLAATAENARSDGVQAAADAIHRTLRHHGPHDEAARGILHSTSTDQDADRQLRAANRVRDALRELDLDDPLAHASHHDYRSPPPELAVPQAPHQLSYDLEVAAAAFHLHGLSCPRDEIDARVGEIRRAQRERQPTGTATDPRSSP